MISVVLVTYNRLHLLRLTVENVLERLSDQTRQIIVWDNASTDGTRDFLRCLQDSRLDVIYHHENIGTNAYARAFRQARWPYLIELDDDVIDAPLAWDKELLDAFLRVRNIGFLAANVVDDGLSIASRLMYRDWRHKYSLRIENGVRLLDGPTGGYCTMTSRQIYDLVGGFKENKHFVFWHEDAAYAAAVQQAGYGIAVLEGLKVFHASGPAYSSELSVELAKSEYYRWQERRRFQRDRIKERLDAVPLVKRLNRWLKLYRIS